MDQLRYETAPAPPPLDRLVHCFWFLRGRTGGTAIQPVVPDGRIEIVIHHGEPFAQVDATGTARRQDGVLVSGQLTRPIALAPSSVVHVVGIRFKTGAARAVLGIALHELTNAVTSLSHVAPRLARALRAAEPTASGLAIALRDAWQRAPSLALSIAQSLDATVAPDLTRLARSLGVSTRTLERRCRTDIGVAPTMVRRVVRFRRAFQRLERTPIGQWSRIALDSGYYDQAHMNRDFREFAGVSPSAFFNQPPELARAFLSD